MFHHKPNTCSSATLSYHKLTTYLYITNRYILLRIFLILFDGKVIYCNISSSLWFSIGFVLYIFIKWMSYILPQPMFWERINWPFFQPGPQRQRKDLPFFDTTWFYLSILHPLILWYSLLINIGRISCKNTELFFFIFFE